MSNPLLEPFNQAPFSKIKNEHFKPAFLQAIEDTKKEIDDIASGRVSKEDNVLINAPHTVGEICSEWAHPYSREQAVFPKAWIKENKFWPYVSRIDNAYGDRNFSCVCPDIESYK